MNYSLTFVSVAVAQKFNEELPGSPTENRVLILSPKEVNQTKTGLIIPEQVKEGVPRKGVVVNLVSSPKNITPIRILLVSVELLPMDYMQVRKWNLKQTSFLLHCNNFWKRTLLQC